MRAVILEVLGFEPDIDTDPNEMDMSKIVGAVHYLVRYQDGSTEELYTTIRSGENGGWNQNVVAAAQVWRDAGGVVPAYVPPTPEEIREQMLALSARQFRLGIVNAGHALSEVEDAIAAIPDPDERQIAEIEWQYADAFHRAHPAVVAIMNTLGFSPEEADVFWEQALVL